MRELHQLHVQPGGLSFAVESRLVSKPSLSIPDQIAQLSARGLADSGSTLSRALIDHGYFRLSGYWRYFQVDPRAGKNSFETGADFVDVYEIYRTDADLRNLLLEGMAEVEIALRAILVAKLCAPGGDGLEYLEESSFEERFDDTGASLRSRLLDDIRTDLARSKERHVVHYRSKDQDAVPFWVATEALSFGILSRMYGLLADDAIRDSIASRFGYLTAPHFATNIRAVAAFRNVCAHHSRIWNRHVRQDVPRIFSRLVDARLVRSDYQNTPWGIIAVLADMVGAVRRNDSFMSDVQNCVPMVDAYWAGLSRPSDK
jgi:abortive infection bacteriophage resistance protein